MQTRMSWEKPTFWLGREALKLTWPSNCLSNTQFSREVEGSSMENALVSSNGQLLTWDHRHHQYQH